MPICPCCGHDSASLNPFRVWMHENDMNGAQVAAMLRITPPFVSQLSRGQRKPSLELAAKIELATGGAVTMRDWFTAEEIAAMRAEIAQADARNAVLKEAS